MSPGLTELGKFFGCAESLANLRDALDKVFRGSYETEDNSKSNPAYLQ